jgi:probable rRNA maturation factor
MSVQVDVQRACDNETVPDNSFVTAWLTRSVAEAGGPADAELSVRIVNEDEMRSLNCAFRGKDKPTNVLSFPAGDVAGLPADFTAPCTSWVSIMKPMRRPQTWRRWKRAFLANMELQTRMEQQRGAARIEKL